MSELKPCPFCGSIAHVGQLKQSVSPRYYVKCSNGKYDCIANEKYIFGRFYVNKQDAINAWNRRASDAEKGES